MYKQSWPAQLRQSLFKRLSNKFNKSQKKNMKKCHNAFNACVLWITRWPLQLEAVWPWLGSLETLCLSRVFQVFSNHHLSQGERHASHERERERELQVWFGIRIQIWGKKIQRSTVWIAELRTERGGGSHWHFGFSLAMCLHRCFDQPVYVFWSHGLLCSGPTLNPNSHLRN